MYDVIVIGAGIIGGMIARKLAAYDLQVCVVEKEGDVAMGATKANSAIVHAGFDAAEGSLKAKLNVRGSEMMPQVTKELGVKYRRNGSLVIGFDEEDKKTIHELLARGRKNGVKDLRIVEGEELKKLEPALSDKVSCALHAPTGAIVCPYELAIAAIGNAMDNGVDLELDFEVSEIRDLSGCYGVISATGKKLETKYIVNAAGLYTDKIAKMIGDLSFAVHPRKGEYILLDKECGSLVSHTVFRTPTKMGKGILITPTVDQNLLLGPTSVDREDKEDTAATAEGFAEIIRQAKENVEGIPFGKTITSFCGLRAVGSTGDFIINSPKERFINVAGIESPGLSATPAIAEYVWELLAAQGLIFVEKSDYNPIRKPAHAFREASMEEKNEIIRKDRSFGKVVCRCESITEGEILEAIRTNPKARDLDGVKRRTRAQMGRCQGGFCGPQIVELLARELNMPYEAVTKSGKGSVINMGRTKEV
ncbi:MAG: NAD(P)/FAD-dependent oxidoreductase [Lachnospiraceae bacterium]|nr:NAD(P)/FAD-dependent oxidoreductase [Lachnospiraceae bacterium]